MSSKKLTRFEDMTVWQEAQELAVVIYSISRKFPKDELYALTSQIRRAASSVSANIAEGFGRNTNKDKSSFLPHSLGFAFRNQEFCLLNCASALCRSVRHRQSYSKN